MRAHWAALRQSLTTTVEQAAAIAAFSKLAAGCKTLSAFSRPSDVIAYLVGSAGDLDNKDQVYARLILAVQADDATSGVASAVIWLGLWPGLSRIYSRNLRYFTSAPEELASELSYHFTAAVAKANLSRICRIAGTLIMNAERDIRAALRRSWAEQARRADRHASGLPPPVCTYGLSELGLPAGLDPYHQVVSIGDVLANVIGDDAELVVGVAIYGRSQREVGERLGLSHEASRKRYQRAMGRLRNHFEA